MSSGLHIAMSNLLALLCGGCCTFNCGISDLAFTSLEHPKPSEIREPNTSRNHYRVAFSPGDLKIRFSTQANLFDLQSRNGTQNPQIFVTKCDDKVGIVTIARIYTDDGWLTDRMGYANEHIQGSVKKKDSAVPPEPVLRTGMDNRITYQAGIHLGSVMYPVKNQYGQGHSFVDLPRDPRLLPDFCFVLGSGGPIFSFSSFRSNEVRLPREAVIDALSNSPVASP